MLFNVKLHWLDQQLAGQTLRVQAEILSGSFCSML